jgi:peptidoglycan hydrolase-like protein with peptidoglycan-binding domain
MASLLAVVPVIVGPPQVFSPPKAHPVKSRLVHVGFVKSSVAAMRSARNATRSASSTPAAADPVSTARSAAATAVQNVAGAVTVVGVTWPRGAVSANDQFQIRTQSGTAWSQWKSLDTDQADGPDPKEAASAVSGTSPYVVTGASRYEVRSLTTDPSPPMAAKVQAVDPGTSNADDTPATAPGTAAAATARPAIGSRASWGANESLRRSSPSYGKVLVGFVHHTVSANGYSAGNVPAMIRGIYAYHVQSLGWNDIGYNFLVDRFGRTWEGRYGGVARAVVGAQTANFNSVSTGVSAIGNYDVAGVPQAMTDAFKRILAWKLSLAGVPATGSVLVNGRRLQRIAGHRDGFATACPGRYLYAKLPTIRLGAAGVRTVAVAVPARAVAATSSATTRYTPFKGVVLRQGSRGTAVLALQRGLRVSADGDFGPITRAALVSFQRQQRLALTGVAVRVVWDRLEKRDYPLIAYRRLVLRQGSRGTAVVAVQRALRVGADGIFGPITAAAVRAVQRTARYPQTGVVSGWTWVVIENRI